MGEEALTQFIKYIKSLSAGTPCGDISCLPQTQAVDYYWVLIATLFFIASNEGILSAPSTTTIS
jgi:hypothetical protein